MPAGDPCAETGVEVLINQGVPRVRVRVGFNVAVLRQVVEALR